MSKAPSTSAAAEPRPAATVIVVRNGEPGLEALLLKRHHGMAFLAGAHVFPGGRVEAGDHQLPAEQYVGGAHAAAQLPGLAPEDAIAHHVAAARELFEEAGVLLAHDAAGRFVRLFDESARRRFDEYRRQLATESLSPILVREGLRLALDSLVLVAHWVTPPGEVRRFDTRFFLAALPPDQSAGHDDRESVDLLWATPAEAIRRCRAGDIFLPPPTWTTMRELETFRSTDEALAWARLPRPIVRREPHFVEAGGTRELIVPDTRFETRFQMVDGRWRAR